MFLFLLLQQITTANDSGKLSGQMIMYKYNIDRLKYICIPLLKLCFSAVFMLPAVVWAIEDVALFDVSLQVASKSDEERRRVAQQALEIVFIRISGDEEVLRNYPALKLYTRKAGNYLSSFNYRQEPSNNHRSQDAFFVGHRASVKSGDQRTDMPRDEHVSLPGSVNANGRLNSGSENAKTSSDKRSDKDRMILSMSFLAEQVYEWMQNASVPIWQAQRPETLLWLTVQDAEGRHLVAEEQYPAVMELLNEQAFKRGLPLIHPLYDLEEQLSVSTNDLWSFSLESIMDGSSKYNSGAVLVGRLMKTSSENLTGEWLLITEKSRRTFSYAGKNIAEFIQEGIALTVNYFAQSYAIRNEGSNEVLTIQIEGVEQYTHYVALNDYLKSINSLNNLQLTYVDGDLFFYNFNSAANLERLRAVIELDKRLSWKSSGSGRLNYYWNE